MSIRSLNKDGLKNIYKDDVALKGLRLVKKYCKSGVIPKEEIDEELLLFLDSERLAFPSASFKDSLSWSMRFLILSDLEIPYIVRYIFLNDFNWRKAVKEYFEKIGEENAEDFVKIVEEILKRRRKFLISGNEITDISMKFGRDGGVVIAELKGAGIISPFWGCGKLFSRIEKIYGSPVYEINRFLIKLYEIT